MCETLCNLGDHLVKEELLADVAANRHASLNCRIPAYFKKALRQAYAEVNLLDDQALTLSSLNNDSPYNYPDRSKLHRAMLLFPTPELVELEMIRSYVANEAVRLANADVVVLN